LLIGLAIAAVVAYCNATASAQLAAQYPTSGGTYVYGREQLGEWPGFIAGWSFVIGKSASCAAMALTFASYAVPVPWQRPTAVVAVVALAAVNYRGITRTALLTRVIVTVSLATLAVIVISGLVGGDIDPRRALPMNVGSSWYGVLQSAGLLFFAFAGYARIATMGEEVRDPGRTIPSAIRLALAIAVGIYATIAVVALGTLGADALSVSSAPLADTLRSTSWHGWTPLVRVGAATASLGALLALIAGVGRTTLAMARQGDLPGWLAAEHPRFAVPHRAEVALAVVVCALVLTTDLRSAIGFSSAGVLIYYLVANMAAFTQDAEQRRTPRTLQVVGALGCAALVATLPKHAVAIALAVVGIGILYRLTRRSGAGTGR
jgi:APA family basic amino acid/polyamine antiporter